MATGEGAGGGGGGGWGADRKVAAEPLVPERTGVLGVIDKGTELAAKGLAEAAVPAAEDVGAVHGYLPGTDQRRSGEGQDRRWPGSAHLWPRLALRAAPSGFISPRS